MTEERGTMAEPLLESLGAALKSSAQLAVAQLKAGLPISLEALYQQAETLLAQVSWHGPKEPGSVWAVRAGELISLQGPNFSLTLTSTSLVLPELLSMLRNGPNAWIVEQEQQAWVVSDQGEVIAQAALQERLERALSGWEEGQARLNCLPPALGRPVDSPLEVETWMEGLLEASRWAAAPARPKAPRCSGCQQPVPAQARFCPHCGKALASPACPRCHTPLPPQARFCSACGQALGKP